MFEIVEELPTCDTDMKYANAAGKIAPIDLFDTELPQTLNLQKAQYP